MLCSRFLKPPHVQRHGGLYNLTERMFDAWARAYDWSLRLSLKHRPLTMAISLVLVGGTVYLFLLIPKGFPERGPGPLQHDGRGDSRHRLRGDGAAPDQVAEIVAQDPDIIAHTSNFGAGGGGGTGLNQAGFRWT